MGDQGWGGGERVRAPGPVRSAPALVGPPPDAWPHPPAAVCRPGRGAADGRFPAPQVPPLPDRGGSIDVCRGILRPVGASPDRLFSDFSPLRARKSSTMQIQRPPPPQRVPRAGAVPVPARVRPLRRLPLPPLRVHREQGLSEGEGHPTPRGRGSSPASSRFSPAVGPPAPHLSLVRSFYQWSMGGGGVASQQLFSSQ